MADLKKCFYRGVLSLVVVCISSESYTFSNNARQNKLCANYAVGEFVPNPKDCHLFYLCGKNGEAFSAACPLNMLFNAQSKLCDTIANVQCSQVTSETTVPAITMQPWPSSSLATIQEYCANAFQQEPNSDSLIFLAHPNQCNQYYMCYYGQALLQVCSTDLQWNSRTGKCDFPLNAKCQNEMATSSLSIAPTVTTAAVSNGIMCPVYGQHIFPHMQHCNMFIYCVKGHAILQQCPFYQYFDVESSCCITRKKALCVKDLELEYRKNTF